MEPLWWLRSSSTATDPAAQELENQARKCCSLCLYILANLESPGYAPALLSFIFPTPADATGTPGARQSLVNSGKETVISRVPTFKGKTADCGTKLGEKSNRNLNLCFLGVTLPGCKVLLVQGKIKIT